MMTGLSTPSQAVNLEAGKNVCVYAVIYGVRKERLASLESPDGLLDIVRWEVRAIHTPYGFIEVEPVQWFTLEGSLSKGV